MKTRTLATVVIGLVVLLTLGFLADQACNVLPGRLQEAEARYRAAVAVAAEKDAQAAEARAALVAAIAEREAMEAALKAEVAQANSELAVVSQQLEALQGQEPPTTPDIEAMPIVISLRAQVRTLSEGFSLAMETIKKQEERIVLLERDKADLLSLVGSWKAQYEREHSLRLAAEGLYEDSQKVFGLFRLSGTVKNVVIGGLAAGTIYGLLR